MTSTNLSEINYEITNMSGVSLAAAPNRRVPKPQEHAGSTGGGAINRMGSLRVIELQLVAFVLVFSASGLVPLLDLLFPALVFTYILLLARFAFPSYGSGSQKIFHGSRIFRFHVIVGTVIGLFLPLAYVLGGFAKGDEHAVRSATPHLFLLSFQILTENIISGLCLFSPPVRALVPIMYTVRRIFVDIDWISHVWLNKTLPANPNLKDVAWFWFGRVLAVANLIYFSMNLSGFLIPRFLPRAFEMYFRERGEILAKAEEDKRSVAINKSQSPDQKKSD